MYRSIIVGHDLHEGGSDALALGRLIAAPTAADLIVSGVFPVGMLPRGFEARWREEEEQVAAEIQAIADKEGAEAEAFPSSSPARGLHELAEETAADLIVVGSSRHSRIGQILAGNVGLGLLHGSPCAVAVAPRGYRDHAPGGLRRIAVGFDGGYEAGLTLLGAVEFAKARGARLELVAVAVPPVASAMVWPSVGSWRRRSRQSCAASSTRRWGRYPTMSRPTGSSSAGTRRSGSSRRPPVVTSCSSVPAATGR